MSPRLPSGRELYTEPYIVRPGARWVDGRRVVPGQRIALAPWKARHEPVDPAPPADPAPEPSAPRKPRRRRKGSP